MPTETTAAMNYLRILIWAAPLVGVAWVLVSDLLRRSEVNPESRGPFSFAAAAALITAAVIAGLAQWAIARHQPGMTVWIQVVIGGGAALAAALLAGHLVRRPFQTGSIPDVWSQADAAAASLAFPVLLGGYLMLRQTARPDVWLPASALGAAAFAAVFAVAGRSLRSAGACARASGTMETFAASCGVIALGILIGRLHYGFAMKQAGAVTTLWLAVSLAVWFVLVLVQSLAFRASRSMSALWFIIFMAAAAWLGRLAATAAMLGAPEAYCFWAGLAAGGLAALLHSCGAMQPGSPTFLQASTVAAALVIAAAALSLRQLAGFGLVCCAAGMLCALPGWSLLAPWRARDGWAQDGLFPSTITWGAGFLAVGAALRVWLEWEGYTTLPAFAPYPFIGLAIGIALPLVLWNIAAASDDTQAGSGGYGSAAVSALLLPVSVCAIVLMTSVVLREPSVRMFLMGLGAAGLAGSFAAANAGGRWGNAPVVSGGIFAALLTLVTSQALQVWSEEAGRPEKVKVLAAVFVLLVLLYALLEIWRLVAARRAPSEVS